MNTEVYTLSDFREIKDLYLEETLTEEEISEGFEPIREMFKVCISSHAWRRMNEELERNCEYEWVESLMSSKANELLNMSMNEEFMLLSNDCKLAVSCLLSRIDGEIAIILKTVIRKVFIDRNGDEIEKRVWIREGSKVL